MRNLQIFVMQGSDQSHDWDNHGSQIVVGEFVELPFGETKYDILLAPMKMGLGYREQPVERYAKYCVFVGEDNYWIRIFEDQGNNGRGAYAIHSERHEKLKNPLDYKRFVQGVIFSLSSDPLDIRRAAKVGEKFASISPGEVV